MKKGDYEQDRVIVNWHVKVADPKQWFVKSHCGPGSKDPNWVCNYCGKPGQECAKLNTETIKSIYKQECGGSGFWCWKCGRFYAQDVCGESYNEEYECVDGSRLTIEEDDHIHCACGAKLFKNGQFEEDMVD